MSSKETLRLCGHCGQQLVERGRSEYRVFFVCGCNRNKGVDWDWSYAIVDGVEYELGSAGSFVHECPSCDKLTFRQRISNELCAHCGKARIRARKIGDSSCGERESYG